MDDRCEKPWRYTIGGSGGYSERSFMFACLRVSNIKESVAFFTEVLVVEAGPMPLARQPGSQYEPSQANNEVFELWRRFAGFLLSPAKKGTYADPGGLLGEFTIIADDSTGLDIISR